MTEYFESMDYLIIFIIGILILLMAEYVAYKNSKDNNKIVKKMKDKNLYNYIFWHNDYEQLWYAIPHDLSLKFFSNRQQFIENKENENRIFISPHIDLLIKKVDNINNNK